MSITPLRLRERITLPDLDACRTLNRWGRRASTRRVFSVVSRLGDGYAWYTLIALVATFGGASAARAALHLAAIGIACALLYRSLKRWTRRPRPYARHPSIEAYLAPLDEYSFPSGHTLHATSFSIVACWYFPMLAWLLLPFTLMIALSRVILGLHYPSDVIAAFAIGCMLASLSIFVT